VCSLSICKLKLVRELDKDLQSVFIALKLQVIVKLFSVFNIAVFYI